MNRRKFFKLIGMGSAVAAFPSIVKSGLSNLEGREVYGRSPVLTAFNEAKANICGPEMTATEVLDRRKEFSKSAVNSLNEKFITEYENAVNKVFKRHYKKNSSVS